MYEEAMERLFSNARNKIQPVTILWGGKSMVVREIRFAYSFNQGSVTRHVFACSNGLESFEVMLSNNDLDVLVRAMM